MKSTSKSIRPIVLMVVVMVVLSVLIVGMASANNSTEKVAFVNETAVSKSGNVAVADAEAAAKKAANMQMDQADSVEIVDLNEVGTYIVQLQDPPLALYAGGIEGLAPTHAATLGESELDAKSPASQAYMKYLLAEQDKAIAGISAELQRDVKVLYQYKASLNGFAVELSGAEALIVAARPDVRFIEPEGEYELHTDAGPAWMGAPGIWDGSATGVAGTMGEGIIVGVIDTGIDPWNPSFLDVGGDAYDHDNPWGAGVYVGVCDSTDPSYDPTFPCNDKLIGAWGYASLPGGPRDSDGHGSHTASTAAGNVVYGAVITTPTDVYTADISGVAPHANIVAYAACCTGSALTAARDQVILDGVDVVNYSIGSSAPTPDPWNSAEAMQWLAVREAGIHVANSAGNSGPGDETTFGPSDIPWISSIGASSHNRVFLTTLVMTNSNPLSPTVVIEGQAMTAGLDTPTDIVFAADYGDNLCGPGSFAPGTFTGQIVVCERGTYGRVEKGQSVADGGAGGYILAQPVEFGGGPGSVATDPHVLPASHIDYYEYQNLLAAYADGYTMGTITGAVMDTTVSNGDIMAAFSSRGANQTLPDLIVPSVTAPGRAIWAAYHQGASDGEYTYNVIQGTSMSSPHVAGAFALIKALHPDWTPAEAQSALMTTARNTVLNDDGINVATPFAQGSGHVDLGAAANAGFVLDITEAEYLAANPADGGDVKELNTASMGNANCVGSCSWTRTVRSVLSTAATYTATVNAPAGITVTISPVTFTLAAGGSQELVITADVSGATLDEWAFASVSFEAAGTISDASMPIAVMPAAGNVPETVKINTQYRSGSVDLTDLQSIPITDLTVDVTGLKISDRTTLSIDEIDDPDEDFPDIFFITNTVYHEITAPADTFSVIAEIADTTSPDLDLLLFYDANDNGIPELSDAGDPDTNPLTCQSASGGSYEFCEILNPTPGRYFVAVINFSSSIPGEPDDADLSSLALPSNSDQGNMTVTGPTAVSGGDPYTLTVNYNEPSLVAGDIMYGAFLIGSDPGNPGNVGTTRVFLNYLGLPVIDVAPATISETIQTGTSVTDTIVISNNGNGDLNWDTNAAGSATELLNDGGFEQGRAGIWTTSNNLTPLLPICTTDCSGGTSFAHTGAWWAWFGGSSANQVFTTASQSVVIPPGSSILEYWILVAAASAGEASMTVEMDGNVLATYTQADSNGAYTLVQIDVSAYADGGSHTLLFDYAKTITGANTNVNMFVDDVSIKSILGGSCVPVSTIPWLSTSPQSGVTAGGDSTDVIATLNAAGLLPGVYAETMCIGSNDPVTPYASVDITLTVEGVPATIDIMPDSVVSTQQEDTVTTHSLTISNTGDVQLDWDATQALSEQDIIVNGSFEGGTDWVGAGDNGSPICDPGCGAALARTGDWWVWFGGWAETNASTASQTVTIPDTGEATLEFWLELNGTTADDGLFEVFVDSTSVFSVTMADAPSYTSYTMVSVDLSAFADGGTYDLVFEGTEIGTTLSGFFLDDVSLMVPDQSCLPVTDISWIDMTPDMGSVGPMSSEMVEMALDSTGVLPGVYSADVCINSNDPVTPLISYPVTMTVTEGMVYTYLPVVMKP